MLHPGRVAARAIQFVYSTEEEEYFEKVCEFVEAKLIALAAQLEDDHELLWLDLERALKSLSHESHRWALSCAGSQV